MTDPILALLLIPKVPVKDYVALIDGELSKADTESLLASKAMELGDFSEARQRMLNSKSYIDAAYKHYREGKAVLIEAQRVKCAIILELYGTSYTLSMKLLNWMQAYAELEQKEIVDEESALLILPEIEIFIESSEELARRISHRHFSVKWGDPLVLRSAKRT